MSDEFTVDELARRAHTRTSTVRLYQTRGLLPPPEIRGRVGYYSTAHLARLRVIDRLQGRGYSLAAIKELLENWARGMSLATIIDPDRELAGFGEPAELSMADFAALFPDGHVDPAVVARASSLGLLTIDEERGIIHAPSRAFVEIGLQLAMSGVPAHRAIAEFEHLAADTRAIAQRFMALFAEYVDPSTTDRKAAVARYHRMAATAVQELLAQALRDATPRPTTDQPSEG